MTIVEIEKLVRNNTPIHKNADNHVQLCYYALQGLYNNYQANNITVEEAKVKKKAIRICFELLEIDIQHIRERYGYYQDNIKLVEMLLSQLVKQSADKDVTDHQLLENTLQILSLMTNEEVTSNAILKNRALLKM